MRGIVWVWVVQTLAEIVFSDLPRQAVGGYLPRSNKASIAASGTFGEVDAARRARSPLRIVSSHKPLRDEGAAALAALIAFPFPDPAVRIDMVHL